jgi:hypothetical protein
MGFLNKLGINIGVAPARSVSRPLPPSNSKGNGSASLPAVGSVSGPDGAPASRQSNGLKEFLWNLDGLGRGTLLDLGPAWQTTLSFFIERGFRVSSEDLLRAWKGFLDHEEELLRAPNVTENGLDLTPTGRAARFMESNLKYPPSSFDAVLLWDLLDYLEPPVARQVVGSVTELLRPGGIVFAMFHTKKPESFHRYRVLDSHTLQIIASPQLCPVQRVYQNREIQDLFGRYRTVKSFVGRDQLRENLFTK